VQRKLNLSPHLKPQGKLVSAEEESHQLNRGSNHKESDMKTKKLLAKLGACASTLKTSTKAVITTAVGAAKAKGIIDTDMKQGADDTYQGLAA